MHVTVQNWLPKVDLQKIFADRTKIKPYETFVTHAMTLAMSLQWIPWYFVLLKFQTFLTLHISFPELSVDQFATHAIHCDKLS